MTCLDATGVELARVDADCGGAIIMLRGIPRVRVGDGITHFIQPHRCQK